MLQFLQFFFKVGTQNWDFTWKRFDLAKFKILWQSFAFSDKMQNIAELAILLNKVAIIKISQFNIVSFLLKEKEKIEKPH